MSEICWVLEGVDAERRRRAIQEAERRGVPLGVYLTEIVARAALADQIAPAAAPEQEAPNALVRRENHLVEMLESRFGLAVEALDGTVCGLAARVEEAEALTAATAEQLNQTLQGAGDHLGALHQRLTSAEEQAGTATVAAAQLADAHEALKHTLADDFSTFAQESAARLNAGLDEVRAAADNAAAETDAAVSRLLQELRSIREAVEARVQESATETRTRIQAAFADATEYMNTLAGRVTDCEQLTVQNAEQLRTQIADIEDNTQTAIEATSAALISDVTAMRQAMDARASQAEEAVRAVLARAQAEWDARHDALRADSDRIEASAFAALEKVANDRAAGDAALHRELADVRDQASGALARLTLLDRAIGARDLFAEVETGAAPLSGRLTQIEATLAAQSAPSDIDREFDQRLLCLEAAHESEATAHALAALRGQIGAVSAKLDAQEIEGAQYLDRLRAQVAAEALQNVQVRVAEFEQRQEAAVEQLRADIARFIDENARRLEALEQPTAPAIAAEFDALRRRIEERILDVEQRSVRALEQAADAMTVLESRFSDGPEAMLRSA